MPLASPDFWQYFCSTFCQPGCLPIRSIGRQNLPAIDIQKLPRDVDVLLGVIADLHSQYTTILESVQQQLLKLRRMHFGASSERLAEQADLFEETVSVPVPPEALESITYERQKSKGRPKLPADLPRTRIEYDLSAEEKAEFERLTKIGEEISETLDFIQFPYH